MSSLNSCHMSLGLSVLYCGPLASAWIVLSVPSLEAESDDSMICPPPVWYFHFTNCDRGLINKVPPFGLEIHWYALSLFVYTK